RLGLDGLDPERLERALAAQVGLLEALAPELEPLPRGLPPQVPVWRP
ncbi:TPA: YscB family type III secretion system chaperone PscB, partial [Pseudomonas aeruginosa]|nr:YscB family type III secretion system chaperone PscB [Pseudomonas aeruginosa]